MLQTTFLFGLLFVVCVARVAGFFWSGCVACTLTPDAKNMSFLLILVKISLFSVVIPVPFLVLTLT